MPIPNNTNYVDPPSKETIEQERRQQLAEQGCAVCGEDDPDKLHRESISTPSCPEYQTPSGPPWKVLCDKHEGSTISYRKRMLGRAAELNDRPHDQRASTVKAVTFYECGNSEFVKRTVDTHPHAVPETHYRCRCGAELDEIVYLGGDDE